MGFLERTVMCCPGTLLAMLQRYTRERHQLHGECHRAWAAVRGDDDGPGSRDQASLHPSKEFASVVICFESACPSPFSKFLLMRGFCEFERSQFPEVGPIISLMLLKLCHVFSTPGQGFPTSCPQITILHGGPENLKMASGRDRWLSGDISLGFFLFIYTICLCLHHFVCLCLCLYHLYHCVCAHVYL